MQRKQKLVAAHSQQQRKGRVSSGNISGRTSLKGDADDDSQLSPEWIRELKRRVRDSRDPVRYMLGFGVASLPLNSAQLSNVM